MSGKNVTLSYAQGPVDVEVHLTGSKSESNRALILRALSGGKVGVENLSSAADTVTLAGLLSSLSTADGSLVLDVGPAGTAMRFLTAYAAINGIDSTVTGTERMKQRPIGILTDALKTLGAAVSFPGSAGYPPVKISAGFIQQENKITIPGNVSSQYITALLLVAPALPLGLELKIKGELTSGPYVEMTLAMLEQCGINCVWNNDVIAIDHQPFSDTTLTIEPDWSAASYWYAIAALSGSAVIRLPYLKKYSLQGDSAIAEIMANFGITTTFENNGLTLTKEDKPLTRKHFDFKDCPDLAQTVIVCCAALGHAATFTGLETLKIKETDRVLALQNELSKIGVQLTEADRVYTLDPSGLEFPEKVFIKTYEDHRMAMAFAPLAMKIKEVEIEDAAVTSKSYPDFWKDLGRAGFIIKQGADNGE